MRLCLLLFAIAERAAANLVVNTYTTRGEPPPDRIPCMTNADCPTSGSCAADPFCPTDQAGDLESDGQYSCQEFVTPGTFGTPSNACDNPSDNGFEGCWSVATGSARGSDEKLKRYCSPRNRDGGMYWTGDMPPPLPPAPPPGLIRNTYTTRGEPPPDRIPCMTEADCLTSGSCAVDVGCPIDQDGDFESDGQSSCQEYILPGTFGTPPNACDDPSANGFEGCWSDAAQAERGSDEKLKRYCSPRNRDGGMYWAGAGIDGGRPPLPPTAPPPPLPPPPSPPDFSNSTEGQLVFGAGALAFILIVGMVAYLVHVRWKVDAQTISRWAGGEKRKGRVAALTFFVRWICIESGLEVIVEFFNYLASVNTGLGDSSSFYIAMVLNVAMILLEWIEVRLTRCHGGKQTPWDRFLFGQWVDSTRKNYYVKYSQRTTLAIHLFINVVCLPTIIEHANTIDSNEAPEERYNSQAEAATFIAGMNSFKTVMGIFMLTDSLGVTLLEPLLAALPKRLKCLRVGPLASPGEYSARDWAITNFLCINVGFVYLNLFWKNLIICGWSPDAFPWNLPNYPGGMYDICDTKPQTFFENVNPFEENTEPTAGLLIGFVAMIVCHGQIFTCGLIWLSRKLPGWGEPPLFDAAESTTEPTKPPPEEKETIQAV